MDFLVNGNNHYNDSAEANLVCGANTICGANACGINTGCGVNACTKNIGVCPINLCNINQ